MEEIDNSSGDPGEVPDATTQETNSKSGQTHQTDTASPIAILESDCWSPSDSPPLSQPRGPAGEQLQESRGVGGTNSEGRVPTAADTAKQRNRQASLEIDNSLAEVRKAWQTYRCTNRRNAVYPYLEAVFALVTRWQGQKCSMKNSGAALRQQPGAPKMKTEPFSIVIFCTCDPMVADAKTRSKWSRVLRLARKAKRADQRLIDFIKSEGGLNECARRFTRLRLRSTG